MSCYNNSFIFQERGILHRRYINVPCVLLVMYLITCTISRCPLQDEATLQRRTREIFISYVMPSVSYMYTFQHGVSINSRHSNIVNSLLIHLQLFDLVFHELNPFMSLKTYPRVNTMYRKYDLIFPMWDSISKNYTPLVIKDELMKSKSSGVPLPK